MPACLHQTEPIRRALGDRLHPGGSELTRRALDLAQAEVGDLILDAGCGPGGGLERLVAWGFTRAMGLDRDQDLLAEAGAKKISRLVAGDLNRLPLAPNRLDLVISECAWNLSDRQAVLAEFWRTLRPGGRLIISDMYRRSPAKPTGAWPLACCFSAAASEERTRDLIESAGFRIIQWEDHTAALRQLAGELIFAHGSLTAFWRAVTGDETLAEGACRAGRQSLPGLFLCVAEKPEPEKARR